MKYRNLKVELEKYGKLLEMKYKAQLKIDKTYASGDTADSISYKAFPTRLNILANESFNYIDDGRGNGKGPLVSSILEWMKAKKVRPRPTKKIRGSKEYQMKKSAFAISRVIAEKGTIERFSYQGSGIGGFVFSNIYQEFSKDVLDAYAEDIKLHVKEQIDKTK